MRDLHFGEWEVNIADNFAYMAIDVYMFRRTPSGKEALTHKGTVVQITDKPAVTNDLYFARMEPDQLQAFANALATYGVKTNNDHKNEGLLEATKAHLEDMRNLVFTPQNIKGDGK